MGRSPQVLDLECFLAFNTAVNVRLLRDRYSAYGQRSLKADESPREPGTSRPKARGGNNMQNLEAVVSDLEWQRLRRRVGGHRIALFVNVGTWAVIGLLKLIARTHIIRTA